MEYASSSENATLSGFLEDVALVSDVDNYDASADAVVMMTVHSAKGLEFPTVFLPGMEDGIFPGMQASMDPSELEEERRLLYVAITRARERLYITHARQRLLFGRTQYNPLSKFVREIPESLMKIEGERRAREEKGDSPFPGYSGRARRQGKADALRRDRAARQKRRRGKGGTIEQLCHRRPGKSPQIRCRRHPFGHAHGRRRNVRDRL